MSWLAVRIFVALSLSIFNAVLTLRGRQMNNDDSFVNILSGAPGVVLIIFVVMAAVFVLMRRSPFLVLARIFRAFTLPFRSLLRALKILPKGGAHAKRAVTMTTGFTPTVGAVFARLFVRETETERALGNIAEQTEPFLKTHRGTLFKWMEPQEGLIRAARSEQGGETPNFEKARSFFSYDIPVRSDPQSLFEDVYSSMIVNQFKESDRACLYVLYEMRKVINDNVRVLSVLFSAIVAIILVINIFYSTVINYVGLIGPLQNISFPYILEIPLTGWQISISAESINKAIFGCLSCLFGIFMMWVFYETEYSHFQRNNGRELNNFLTRYLAQLTADFRSAETKAMASIVGSQDNASDVGRNSAPWVVGMNWIAFRFFSIESFLTGIVYQILRNSSYYLFYVPFSFLFVIYIIASLVNFDEIKLTDLNSEIYNQNTFYVFFILLLLVYYGYLKKSVDFVLDSIREQEWTQFHTLDLSGSIAEVINKYSSEIDFYRNRFRTDIRS